MKAVNQIHGGNAEYLLQGDFKMQAKTVLQDAFPHD